MEVLITILVFLFVFFALVTLIGHGLWVVLAWAFRALSGKATTPTPEALNLNRCPNCGAVMPVQGAGCTACGWRRPTAAREELMRDLGATHRLLLRFRQQNRISEAAFGELMRALQLERERHQPQAGPVPHRTERPAPETHAPQHAPPPPPARFIEEREPEIASPTSFIKEPPVAPFPVEAARAERPLRAEQLEHAFETASEHRPGAWTNEERAAQRRLAGPARSAGPFAKKPRRPLTEVLAAFMEQSNIRWGEIIGGLLIIGCSTALVVSLWTEISRIPVLKFFIFTTVTAALFGVGLYTEHRWKLPTTSRGILTIATLLVPLNFLAIAAVSRGEMAAGGLVLVSELVAPALFLCLVFFAGRIITPLWPHLLVFGVLGSSIGQLLMHHFASAGMPPQLLVALGFFPLICLVAATGWMLGRAAREAEIDESLANNIFVTLGASFFATLLSLGLLLFKVGWNAETLMQLAPLLTLGGGPLLASGLLLWRRVVSPKLVSTRVVGTSIALAGACLMLAGILLSFPNPASVVPAALIAFLLFTGVALFFEEPRAHLFAAFSFALCFLTAFLAARGQVSWQAPGHVSLLSDLLSAHGGQAMALLFVLYLVASEGLRARGRELAGRYYLWAAAAVGGLCLLVFMPGRVTTPGDPYLVAPIFFILAAGAFFIALRTGQAAASWAGSVVLLLALGKLSAAWLGVRFPWQAALLAHASLTGLAAIACWREGEARRRVFGRPLNLSAFISTLLVLIALLEAYAWEPTALYAQRLLWLAGVWCALLWLNRSHVLFAAMQLALTTAVVLPVKLGLQSYEWYAYEPNAWLHPWSLQIQGSVLVLLSLAWLGFRIFVRRKAAVETRTKEATEVTEGVSAATEERESWSAVAWGYLDRVTFDRVLTGAVLVAFVLMGFYAALQGVKLELTIRGGAATVWNLAGFPHELAAGAGAWILLALLLLSTAANYWERRREAYALGALLALSAAVPLLAANWEPVFAAATAWRWLAALFLLLMSLPFWWRGRLSRQLVGFGMPERAQEGKRLVLHARWLLLALTIIPLLTLTIYPVLKAVEYLPVHGPSGGLFYSLGAIVSYAFPLALASLALIGHGWREREAGYVFAAGLLLALAATSAQVLAVASVNGSMNRVVAVQVLQLNAVVAGCFALVWLGTLVFWERGQTSVQKGKWEELLSLQVWVGIGFSLLATVPLALWLCARPERAGIATFEAGSVRGWLAVALPLVASFWLTRAFRRSLNAWLLFAVAGLTGTLTAFVVTWAQADGWAGYHTLLAASALTGWVMLLARKLPALVGGSETVEPLESGAVESDAQKSRSAFGAEWEWEATLYACIAGAWTVLLALRAAPSDPLKPWWTVGALVAMSAMAAALHWETLARGYLYVGGGLLNLAASIWYLSHWGVGSEFEIFLRDFRHLVNLSNINIVALALPGVAWLWLELRARRLRQERRTSLVSFHHVAAALVLFACLYQVSLRLLIKLNSIPFQPSVWLEWAAVFSTIALLTASLWDRRARYAVAGLHLMGLVFAATFLARLDLNPSRLSWLLLLVTAAYAVMTSFIWHTREPVMAVAERWGVPSRREKEWPGLLWLSVFNGLLAAVVVLLGCWSVLSLRSWPMRLAAAGAVGAQVLSFGMLAEGPRRSVWLRVGLALLSLGLVFFGWSFLAPAASGTWLNRAVVLMIVMIGLIALDSASMNRERVRASDWSRAAESIVPWLAGTGALALIFVLLTEVAQMWQYGGVRINLPALITVGLILLAAGALCILFAVSPSHDPLKLTESGRMKYVYAAEVLLALLFMHVRLTMPWLFTGFFARYWPLVIVAIAYLGVGLSEFLRRQGLVVLAHPVERTGVLLPLLPVLGYWMIDSQVNYSLVLFAIGMLYGGLSILRHSLVFGVLAAFAGNGALWYLLNQTGDYRLTQHPQMWLIPVAASVLVAAYLNRERLSEEQMMSIRYVSLMTIYVSSTSDIFINGVADSPWLPLVLAGLSLAGVLFGIMFRVRAFLFLGATFLLIAIITMIYYASANLGWTWLWYVAGIATGALIIFTFALFEKKRAEMLQVLADLRGWER